MALRAKVNNYINNYKQIGWFANATPHLKFVTLNLKLKCINTDIIK